LLFAQFRLFAVLDKSAIKSLNFIPAVYHRLVVKWLIYMPDLTPEERQRIYEEEKARHEARGIIAAKKRRRWLLPTILAIIGLMFIIGILSILAPDNPYANYRAVVYSVEGYDTGVVSLTYANESGGSEQRTVVLPWRLQFSAPVGRHLYVSAQQSGEGRIDAEIKVSGQVVQSAESTTRYGIATVSGIAQ
jgi:hypothetical protein